MWPRERLRALRERRWRTGAPQAEGNGIRALQRVDAQRVIVQHTEPEDIDALELLASEVLPDLADVSA